VSIVVQSATTQPALLARAEGALFRTADAPCEEVGQELQKPLPADSEDQAIELENQEALEVIEKTETTEIHQIEVADASPARTS
jgi:hypothetical protein